MFNFFRKLFRKGPPPPPPPAGQKAADQEVIKVFDRYGRELSMTKSAWRTQVLPTNIKSNWNNADALYSLILSALRDGFGPDVLSAADRLFAIDPNRERAELTLAVILMENKQLDRAQRVLEDHLAAHPKSAYGLTNLAKIYDRRGDHAKAEDLLWQGLTIDPNQDNGLGWYMAIHNQRAGEREALKACRRAAAIPGAWRPQLWMARDALRAGEKSEALTLYRQALANAGAPAPELLLMQMSGDLGNAGCLRDIIALAEPAFDPALHGIAVGNNLIKAHLDLGDPDRATQLLEQLYAQKRPDWQQTLTYWDTEIARRRVADTPPPQDPSMVLCAIEGPVWLDPTSPAAKLFEPKSPDDFLVAFLTATVETSNAPDQPQLQLADAPGRLSRALPLLLSEHIFFATRARTVALIPWLSNRGGFVVFGRRASDSEAFTQIKPPPSDPPASPVSTPHYLVVPHIDARAETWRIELRVLRPADGQTLARIELPLNSRAPTTELTRVCEEALRALTQPGDIHAAAPSPSYRPPTPEHQSWYAVCLEQLLAIRCAAMDPAFAETLHGARNIIDGMINLCLEEKHNPTLRILLAQSLKALKRSRPEILPEFRDKLTALQSEGMLPPDAKAAADEMVKEAFA